MLFFPPINAIKGELLDVNAIHILLGTRGLDRESILNEIKQCQINSIKLTFNNRTVLIDEYIKLFENEVLDDLWINQIIKKILQRDIKKLL